MLRHPRLRSHRLRNGRCRRHGGDGAYLAYYVTDAQGKYVGRLWMAGGRTRYYEHITGWYRA
ncbi:DUF2271 domain-containing protein, partial [Rhizobium ruizarguesonis]